jgi:thioredoxin
MRRTYFPAFLFFVFILIATHTEAQHLKPNTDGTIGISMPAYEASVKSDKLVLVDFNAVWCGPCQVMKPILEKIGKKRKNTVIIMPIDVDQNPQLADGMKIRAIPLLVLYKNGKEVWRFTGSSDRHTIESAIEANSK